MRISKETTVALLVDVQDKLFPHIKDSEQLAEKLQIICQGLLKLQIPIITTEQYTKGLGVTIEPLRMVLNEKYQPIEKMSFSCLGELSIREKLHELQPQHVILIGIEAHVCVLQTAIDLQEIGCQSVMVTDCIGSRNETDKVMAFERAKHEGVILSTYEAILLELCEVAGTPVFKSISKIIK